MKIQPQKHAHFEAGPNMTPLVDVVMVILIFLMLAGSFAAGHFLPSKTPVIVDGRGLVDIRQQAARLEVFISSPNSDSFRARIGGSEQSFTDPAALREALDVKRQAHEAAGNAADNMQVMISPRLNTPYRHVTATFEAAMDAKWPKVGFNLARQ